MRQEMVTYQSWKKYVFSVGMSDDEKLKNVYASDVVDEEIVIKSMSVSDLVDYICRALEDIKALRDAFTSRQLADGIWYIFSVSSYFHWIITTPVPPSLQVRLIKSCRNLYFDILDPVSVEYERQESKIDYDPIATCVIMFFDSGGLDLLCREGSCEVCHALVDLLDDILNGCSSISCQESALQGLQRLGLDRNEICPGLLKKARAAASIFVANSVEGSVVQAIAVDLLRDWK